MCSITTRMTKAKTALELPDMLDRKMLSLSFVDTSVALIPNFPDTYSANLNKLLNDFREFVQSWLIKISTIALIKFFLLIIIYKV